MDSVSSLPAIDGIISEWSLLLVKEILWHCAADLSIVFHENVFRRRRSRRRRRRRWLLLLLRAVRFFNHAFTLDEMSRSNGRKFFKFFDQFWDAEPTSLWSFICRRNVVSAEWRDENIWWSDAPFKNFFVAHAVRRSDDRSWFTATLTFGGTRTLWNNTICIEKEGLDMMSN